MTIFKLTGYAKPVRKSVGEHGSTAACEAKPIILYLFIIESFLWLAHRRTNEDSSILPP
jgi:hypothetical protein